MTAHATTTAPTIPASAAIMPHGDSQADRPRKLAPPERLVPLLTYNLARMLIGVSLVKTYGLGTSNYAMTQKIPNYIDYVLTHCSQQIDARVRRKLNSMKNVMRAYCADIELEDDARLYLQMKKNVKELQAFYLDAPFYKEVLTQTGSGLY